MKIQDFLNEFTTDGDFKDLQSEFEIDCFLLFKECANRLHTLENEASLLHRIFYNRKYDATLPSSKLIEDGHHREYFEKKIFLDQDAVIVLQMQQAINLQEDIIKQIKIKRNG